AWATMLSPRPVARSFGFLSFHSCRTQAPPGSLQTLAYPRARNRMDIVDGLSISTAMLTQDLAQLVRRLNLRPVPQPSEDHLLPGLGPGPGMEHLLKRQLLGFLAGTPGSVGDYLHVIALLQSREYRETNRDFGPQARDQQALAPGFPHRVQEVRVL